MRKFLSFIACTCLVWVLITKDGKVYTTDEEIYVKSEGLFADKNVTITTLYGEKVKVPWGTIKVLGWVNNWDKVKSFVEEVQ